MNEHKTESKKNSKNIRVRMRNNFMEAYIYLLPPTEDEYTLEELQEALDENGVQYGIDENALQMLIDKKIYEEEILIAAGEPSSEGRDGYFKYNFKRDLNAKPTLKANGMMDYWSLNLVEMVTKDQVIATYEPVIKGVDGMDVKGTVIKAKLTRDLPPLKGRGFERSEDNLTYTSMIDGKIEMQNNRVFILPVYEVNGDADLSIGHINFNGDVIIHGSVLAGVKVKAVGSVTIDGIVEATQIEAGKDIILRSGMLGQSKSKVISKGNIFAKFFEYTTVESEGDIQADSFLNCEIHSKGSVNLIGKKGNIIGGNVWAIQGVEAQNLGNDVEVKTYVRVGNDIDVYRRIKELDDEINELKNSLKVVERGLADFKIAETKNNESYHNNPRKTQMLRVKIRDSALVTKNTNELKKLQEQVESAKGACIKVMRFVCPGVIIGVDNLRLVMKDKQLEVEFYRLGDKIRMVSLE